MAGGSQDCPSSAKQPPGAGLGLLHFLCLHLLCCVSWGMLGRRRRLLTSWAVPAVTVLPCCASWQQDMSPAACPRDCACKCLVPPPQSHTGSSSGGCFLSREGGRSAGKVKANQAQKCCFPVRAVLVEGKAQTSSGEHPSCLRGEEDGAKKTRGGCVWTHGDEKGLWQLWAVLPDCNPPWHVSNPSHFHRQCQSPPGHPAPQGGCHTFILSITAEQTDFLEVAGGGDREGQDIPDGLVEARVGPAAEGHGLVLVLQVVLDVAHLMVHCEQLLHGHRRALLDPAVSKTALPGLSQGSWLPVHPLDGKDSQRGWQHPTG